MTNYTMVESRSTAMPISATPLPPMALVRGGTPTTKAADNGGRYALRTPWPGGAPSSGYHLK